MFYFQHSSIKPFLNHATIAWFFFLFPDKLTIVYIQGDIHIVYPLPTSIRLMSLHIKAVFSYESKVKCWKFLSQLKNIFSIFSITDLNSSSGIPLGSSGSQLSEYFDETMGLTTLYLVISRFESFTSFMSFYDIEVSYISTVNLPVPPIKYIVYHDFI